jgi:hypothetical protein
MYPKDWDEQLIGAKYLLRPSHYGSHSEGNSLALPGVGAGYGIPKAANGRVRKFILCHSDF